MKKQLIRKMALGAFAVMSIAVYVGGGQASGTAGGDVNRLEIWHAKERVSLVKFGMTRDEVEGTIWHSDPVCVTDGATEHCTYGGRMKDDGQVSVDYTNGRVSATMAE